MKRTQDGWLVQRDGDDEMTWEATIGDTLFGELARLLP